jgi:hypothetical protein
VVYVAEVAPPCRFLFQGAEFMGFFVMSGRLSPVRKKLIYVAPSFSSAGHDRRPIFEKDFFIEAHR